MGKLHFDDLRKDEDSTTKKNKETPMKKAYSARYRRIRRGSMKPYDTWKQEFMLDRCCNEKDFIKELVISSTPHVLLNLLLIAYLLFGTVLLQYADEGIGEADFSRALLFIFTTILTIGYGKIVPTTDIGKLVCIAYCVIGIPLIFLVLSNNGQFVVEAYWIIRKSGGGKNDDVSKGLPLWLSMTLLCLHSLMGGLIFSTWMGQMRFFDAIYCTFISVSTIGYGDLVPAADTWGHTVAIIAFFSAGVVILSTLFDRFGCYLQYVHYIGRQFRGRKDVEIWFGGSVLTVQELITLVAEQFGVCPRRLRAVLRNLDSILEAATSCDETFTGKNLSELSTMCKIDELLPNESPLITLQKDDPRAVLLRQHAIDVYATITPLYRISSNSSMQKMTVRDTENALQALRVIHHKLNKPALRQSVREQQRKRFEIRRTLTE
uniref:Ion_trans_2 domain-containing protein n=1 Tax=Haemonchus contortus TaxID=6289 RepID=A0A6F7NUE2_HAECO|nr:Ion transport 2 domain containing protein [Haemonchus contortus]